MDTAILTSSSRLFRANGSTNSTTSGSSIGNPVWTATEPSGVNVHAMGKDGQADGAYSRNGLLILPYGVGSNANTFLMTVFAWDWKKGADAGSQDLWVAWPLLAVTCTLTSAITGVNNTDVPAANFGVSTITMTTGVGTANVSNEIISPTGSLQASIVLDTKGCKLIQFSFAMNGSATSANALVRRI